MSGTNDRTPVELARSLRGSKRQLEARNPEQVTKYFQRRVRTELKRSFFDEVEVEWRAVPHEERMDPSDTSRQLMYAPVVDVAVGPFALDGQYIEEYDALLEQHCALIQRLIKYHQSNVVPLRRSSADVSIDDLKHVNANARCLLAIEVERGNADQKYLMGSIVNAVALGRVGIIVCWDKKRLQEVLRLGEYVQNLYKYQKNILCPKNLLIVTPSQMYQALGFRGFSFPRIGSKSSV